MEQNINPLRDLREKAKKWNLKLEDLEFAKKMDEEDELKDLRKEFYYPKKKDLPSIDKKYLNNYKNEDDRKEIEKMEKGKEGENEECLYFCGHSLGLMTKLSEKYVIRELDKWGKMGVEGHTHGDLPWAWCDELLVESTSRIIGCKPEEVALMNGLTINLHLLLVSFYQPTPQRHKIMLEKQAFPSDHYCIESQIRTKGFDPLSSMIIISPREGEELIREEDLLRRIEEEGDEVAVVIFGGVHYFTGQLFPMQKITEAAKKKGCYVGFDLAHAIGNVPLHLHDWGVDFACWCSYKYLCSGAGGLAGIYINEKFHGKNMPQYWGWWGHKMETRFQMTNVMDLIPGPLGYRNSNTPGLLAASLMGSLQVYDKISMEQFRKKSLLLTTYLEFLILSNFGNKNKKPESGDKKSITMEIITPSNPSERGCHLSLTTSVPITPIFQQLTARGVVLDKREPNVLRLSGNPLYNKFSEINNFVQILKQIIHEIHGN